MIKIILTALFISPAFAQIIEVLPQGTISVKPASFILDKNNAGLTFVFIPYDKSSPELNYYQIPIKTPSQPLTTLIETDKHGIARSSQSIGASTLQSKIASSIYSHYQQYKKHPEIFENNPDFIHHLIHHSTPDDWIIAFESVSSRISILKKYLVKNKDSIHAVVRSQDLTDGQIVTSSEIGRIKIFHCQDNILYIEQLDGSRKSLVPVDMQKDNHLKSLILTACKFAI